MNEVGPYQWAPPLGQVTEGQDIWSGMSYMCALTTVPSKLQITVKNRFTPLGGDEEDGDELAVGELENNGEVEAQGELENNGEVEVQATQLMLRRQNCRMHATNTYNKAGSGIMPNGTSGTVMPTSCDGTEQAGVRPWPGALPNPGPRACEAGCCLGRAPRAESQLPRHKTLSALETEIWPVPEPKSQSQSRRQTSKHGARDRDMKHRLGNVDDNVPSDASRHRRLSALRNPPNMIEFYKKIVKPSQRQRKAQAKEVMTKGTPATTTKYDIRGIRVVESVGRQAKDGEVNASMSHKTHASSGDSDSHGVGVGDAREASEEDSVTHSTPLCESRGTGGAAPLKMPAKAKLSRGQTQESLAEVTGVFSQAGEWATQANKNFGGYLCPLTFGEKATLMRERCMLRT